MPFTIPDQEFKAPLDGVFQFVAVHDDNPGLRVSVRVTKAAIEKRAGRSLHDHELAAQVSGDLRYYAQVAGKLRQLVRQDSDIEIGAEDVDAITNLTFVDDKLVWDGLYDSVRFYGKVGNHTVFFAVHMDQLEDRVGGTNLTEAELIGVARANLAELRQRAAGVYAAAVKADGKLYMVQLP